MVKCEQLQNIAAKYRKLSRDMITHIPKNIVHQKQGETNNYLLKDFENICSKTGARRGVKYQTLPREPKDRKLWRARISLLLKWHEICIEGKRRREMQRII